MLVDRSHSFGKVFKEKSFLYYASGNVYVLNVLVLWLDGLVRMLLPSATSTRIASVAICLLLLKAVLLRTEQAAVLLSR